jgi:hypothetical protein
MAERQRLGSLVWFMRISAASASGLSAAAYCRSQGWPYATFMAWRGRLSRDLAGGTWRFRSMGLG